MYFKEIFSYSMNKREMKICYKYVQSRFNDSIFTQIRKFRNSKKALFKSILVFYKFTKQKT